jgi:NAD(P)-dependent dehydrogenase (short-subunit alcohol dehydrogenase family)
MEEQGMKELAGKVAVVTGAGSGIGLAMAQHFAGAGMKLALLDIDGDALSGVADEFKKADVEVLPIEANVADADRMDAVAQEISDHFGSFHVVCNNAGVGGGGNMWELTPQDWEFVMGPNLWGVIHGVRAFGSRLVAQNEGHIVNTASMAGLISVQGMGPYNVTKHAVVTLSETLKHDLVVAEANVGVSVLCPGFVQTRVWDAERYRKDEPGRVTTATAEEIEVMQEAFRAMIAEAMPAEKVGQAVLDAVREDRFYITPHESTGPAVEDRMRRIIEGRQPASPELGFGVFAE